ncbi:Aste57867_17073 [Aphanomyces stellatus]|uniref:Aste57867_17073 protein n=1 Tax=Aphanomyces stellatus TaxID=120398 RepID=A0A485L8S1_9STRA|nr:hypothetical protein As57867_017015 [Aphanomyces stellatus]VFT93834.1 Aste57867_17073 [Aphanomyces stellatus]
MLAEAVLCGLFVLFVYGAIYVVFQLHLMPRPIARVVAKIYFFPMYPFTLLARRGNYYTAMDPTVILGAVPVVCAGHVTQMVSLGVRAVVNVCDEYEGPIDAYKKQGIVQLRVPTVDHTEASVSDIQKSIEFIEVHKKLGAKVYVHCKAGSGRSAAIVFCWLLKTTKMTPLEVQSFMSVKRRVRRKLYKQKNVLEFYETLKPLEGHGGGASAAKVLAV